MALHGELRVNGMTIGTWEAQRATHTAGTPKAEDIITYDCTARQDSAPDGCAAVLWRGQVSHRYGDGALALAARVLLQGALKGNV